MDVHPPSISCVSSSWSIATWENRKKRVLVKLIVTKTSCLSTKHTGHSPNCVADWQMCAETKCLNLCFPSPSILTHSHFLFMLSEWQPVGRCWDINSHSWTSHDQRPWPASFGWTPAPEHVKTPFTLDLAGPGEHLTFWLCTVRTWMDGCMAWHGMAWHGMAWCKIIYIYIHNTHYLILRWSHPYPQDPPSPPACWVALLRASEFVLRWRPSSGDQRRAWGHGAWFNRYINR